MKLYELTSAYSQLEQLIDSPDADEQQLAKYLDECEGALQEKATNIAMVIGNLETVSEGISNAIANMSARKSVVDNRIASIKRYILTNMQAANIQKIECDLFRISRRKNPPSVVIDDEAAIPLTHLRQPEPPPPKPDKKAILADMKEGCVVDGCHLEQNERLEIK